MSKSNALKNLAIGTADVIIQNLPDIPALLAIKIGWASVRVAVAVSNDLLPEETREYWQEIELATKNKFELLNSVEFKQSLTNTFDSFVKARDIKKRQLIKEIFLSGYISTSDYNNFEIERMNEVATRISLPALQHLKFLLETILPMQTIDIEKNITEVKKDTDLLRRGQKGINPLSKYLGDWIYNEHNINSDKFKNDKVNSNDIDQINNQGRIENMVRDNFTEYSNELLSLSILRPVPTFDTQGFDFTQFGVSFGKYVSSLSFVLDN